MKQVLIPILVLCHLGACLWSCYKPGRPDLSQEDSLTFTGANLSQDKKRNTHVNWQISGKSATVQIYGSKQKDTFASTDFLASTQSKYLKIPSEQMENVDFLHLIIVHHDTLVMAIDRRRLGLLKPKKSRNE